jgi:beta-glucanase (GH16 family)
VDYSEDFHIFAVVWNRKELIWYIDYQERFRTEHHIPTEPFFLLANLAVGGHWPGDPDQTTPFPSYYEIDYIHVYQQECKSDGT